MFRNFSITAIRNIIKSPLYSFINILSLAIGIASCIVIFLFVQDESSFDNFHTKGTHIYRLDEVQTFNGTKPQKVALSMPGMGPAMLADFPEVKSFTRFHTRGKRLYESESKQFLIDQSVAVDSTFLNILDFKLLIGDRLTALDLPNSMVITEETALKFFKSTEHAIGNSLSHNDQAYKITGVLMDVPENSHLQFDILISMATITSENPEFNDRWGSNFLNTYLVLESDVDLNNLESKFDDFLIRHMENETITDYYKLFLQPLNKVHLGSTDIEHDYNNHRKFNGSYLDVFTLVGIFILIIASVNFMNLTTARSSHRWKEIGVRKSVGAQKSQLFLQFMSESILLSFLALIFGFLLNLLFIPLLNGFIDRQLTMLTLFDNSFTLLAIVVVSLTLGLVAGLYPSLYMTAFKTANVLKGGQKTTNKSIFKSSLIIVQFGLAVAMIVSTLIVIRQLNFMKNKDIGFDIEQMLVVDMNGEANDKFDILKQELKNNIHVLGVTASGQRIGNNFHQWGFKVKTDTGLYEMTPSNVHVDYDYMDVYGIKLKDGRGFSQEFSTDNGLAFVVNEALAKELGLEKPIGTSAGHSWYPDDSLGSIIGVTEDFNFNSLHHKVNTLSMVVHPDWGYDEMSIKIHGDNVQEAVDDIRGIWEQHVTDWPFQYTFLDEHFEELYESDQQMTSVVTIMAILAIAIACMGLFALAAITTERKIKEVGIRKVLGASVVHITYVLAKGFLVLIVIAFFIASPITYYLLEKWLENFAFRVDISIMLFIAGGVLAIFIALATMSYHIIKSALGNPIKALRYE